MAEINVKDNLMIYSMVRDVPKEAQKPIVAGRLKGMTDINPMWRIKILTEVFGAAGFGWYTEVLNKWIDNSEKEAVAWVEINLYVKQNDEWSKPIYGIGGAKFIAQERSGAYTDDEAYKKAYTDAISVACKALGVGAAIYWSKDSTKYNDMGEQNSMSAKEAFAEQKVNRDGADFLEELCKSAGESVDDIKRRYKVNDLINLSLDDYNKETKRVNAILREKANTTVNTITRDQANTLEKLIKESGTDLNKFMDAYRITDLIQLPAIRYETEFVRMTQRIKAKEKENERTESK